MKKLYNGICYACKKESKFIERDHRVPPQLGGDRSAAHNIQDLCVECHVEKSSIDIKLMSYGCSTQDVERWLELAFRGDKQLAETFLMNLSMRLAHLKEVFEDKYGEQRNTM